MDLDVGKIFENIRVENALLLLGVLSLLISIYNQYLLGMKVGFLFMIFGGIFRFYGMNIVRGTFINYLNKPKYLKEVKEFNEIKKDYIKVKRYIIPFSDSWYIHLIDFTLCLIILTLFTYIFIYLIE